MVWTVLSLWCCPLSVYSSPFIVMMYLWLKARTPLLPLQLSLNAKDAKDALFVLLVVSCGFSNLQLCLENRRWLLCSACLQCCWMLLTFIPLWLFFPKHYRVNDDMWTCSFPGLDVILVCIVIIAIRRSYFYTTLSVFLFVCRCWW